MKFLASLIELITALFKSKADKDKVITISTDNQNNSNQESDDPFQSDEMIEVVKDKFDESRIIQDYSVTQKWHNGWKRPLSQITEVVIHHTAGNGNIDTLKKWMLGGERKDSYKKGIALFHFAIDKDGRIWKAGPISRWWYHSCSGKHDRFTVGIENIHKSGPFTPAQYKSLFWILFEYMPHFCPNYHRIVSHDYNYNTYSNVKKGCPGPDFDWTKLEKEIKRRNINFETHGFEEYTLKFS